MQNSSDDISVNNSNQPPIPPNSPTGVQSTKDTSGVAASDASGEQKTPISPRGWQAEAQAEAMTPPMVKESQPPTSNLQPPTKSSIISRKSILIASVIILVISSFALSFFFSIKSRQPKPTIRASAPTPSIKPPVTTPNMPTQPKSSGNFGNFLPPLSPSLPPSTLSPSPIEPSDNNVTAEPSPQPTTDHRPPTTDNRLSPTPIPDRVTFDITAENNSFSPRLLTATVGQVIVIYVTAKDKDYDIAIPDLNLKKIFKKGVKSSLEFQALSFGDFTFRCTQACDNADSAQGVLTIRPL